MAELQMITSPTGDMFLRRDDLVTVLKAMADDLLSHIPNHAQAGEFLEALQDRWAAGSLNQAAEYFEGLDSAGC